MKRKTSEVERLRQRVAELKARVTELTRTSKTLRGSEMNFRSLFDQSSDAIVVFDPNTLTMLQFNNEACLRLGYSRKEFANLKLSDLEVIESAEDLKRHVSKVPQNRVEVFETKQRTKQGALLDVEIRARAVCIGGTRLILGVWRDITQCKRAEQALRESEERFRTMFSSSPDPAWIIEEHRFVECNQAAIDVLGYSDKNSLKNTHPSRLSPEFQPDGEASYSKAERMMFIAQEKGFNRFEWVHRRRDQSDFFAEVTLFAILLQGRQILYCIWKDITERKKAEAALTDEHNLYMDLVKSLPAGVYRLHIRRQKRWKKREWVGKVESNYRIEVMSNSFCRLLGASRQKIEANAATVVDCLHPDDRPDFVRRNVIALETMQPFEWEGRVKHHGPTQWVRFLSVPRSMPNGDVIWTGVLLDTTAVKRAMESLQKSREELEDRVRERTARLHSLASQLTRAEHAERRRIAYLLHEDLQQRLAAINYKVHELKDSVQAGSALRTANRTIHELNEAIDLTRDLTKRLAPPVLYLSLIHI